jgi:hypothetical protein
MRCKSKSAALKSAALGTLGLTIVATALWAQEPGGPGAPWRGAGAPPCFGPDGGTFQCRPAAGVVAVRAGRLFDSKSGELKTNQVILLQGERIRPRRLIDEFHRDAAIPPRRGYDLAIRPPKAGHPKHLAQGDVWVARSDSIDDIVPNPRPELTHVKIGLCSAYASRVGATFGQHTASMSQAPL